MKIFAFWYTYFDTIFLRKTPIPNSTLISMIPPTTDIWPQKCSLPELSQCFSELQTFILEQKNWSESICTIDQLNCIQSDVTNVLILLEIQKLYILHFWHSKRRVEASVAHLYAILQIFVGSIIPYHNMTLFQCKAANKLCVRIVNLQNLFKSIMSKINGICSFFSDRFFDEEDAILRNFFENFVAFMQMIPKVKKARMFHVSELLKYVMIVNTLQIASGKVKNIKKHEAKTNRQVQLQNKKKTVSDRKVKSLQKLSKGYPLFNGYVIRKEKKCQSCYHLELATEQNNEHYTKTKNLLRFIFPNWIRRHSIKHRKQSLPKLNIEPIAKAIKGKSNTEFRRNSPSQEKKTINRNLSASKPRVLSKSNSLVDGNLSPTKYGLKKVISVQKVPIVNENHFDEDEQNNVVQKTSSLLQVKQKKHSHVLKSQNYKRISLLDLDLEQKDDKMAQLIKNYTIIKELESILLT